jgi:hypothetical protein
MAKPNKYGSLDRAEVLEKLNKLTGETMKTINPMFKTFAKFQELRATRLRQELKQIKNSVGEEHPDYIAVQAAAARSSQTNRQFKTQAARIEKRPAPKAFEWLVYGQVFDIAGTPAKGLHVRVFDHDRKYDDLLGETETDIHGDFTFIYHERDFAAPGKKLPELYVMVYDNKGKTLHSSRDKIRFEAGKSEYFVIRLGKGTKSTATKTKPAVKRTRRKK